MENEIQKLVDQIIKSAENGQTTMVEKLTCALYVLLGGKIR